MKMYQIYICDVCGFESKNRKDVELCEAKHLGLNTIEEMHDYMTLQAMVKYLESTNRKDQPIYSKYVCMLNEFKIKHAIV